MKGTRAERMLELTHRYPRWEPKTIWEHFESAAHRHPDRDFLVCDSGKSYTYRQARDEVERLARGFHSLGVQANDHVAVKMENSPELVFVALALYRLQAVKVAVYAGVGPYEVAHVVSTAEASVLVSNTDIAAFPGQIPLSLKTMVSVRGAQLPEGIDSITWDELRDAGQHAETSWPSGDPDAVADIIFTSGTTGDPKGVPLTHDMLLRSSFASALNRGFEDGRRAFVPLPLLHCYGLVQGLLGILFVDGAILINDGSFDAQKSLSLMREACANDVLCVPIQMEKLVKRLVEAPERFPDLHAVYCSGAPCPTWVLGAIREQLHVEDIINGYGMTETTGATVQTVPGDSLETVDTRVGKLLPTGCVGFPEYGGHLCECRVIDPEKLEDCAIGQVGELWWRGATVTKCYVGGAGREDFLEDGWFRSGDLGFVDEHGYYAVVGRIKESYRINGENVSPRFLERIIERCPLVSRAVVVGIPHERLGAVGALFAQLVEDTPANREAVQAFCKANLATHQVPKYYRFLRADEWPTSHTGKVQAVKLRESLEAELAKA